MSQFWPLLNRASFYKAAGAVLKIGSSPNQTTICNFSLPECSVDCLYALLLSLNYYFFLKWRDIFYKSMSFLSFCCFVAFKEEAISFEKKSKLWGSNAVFVDFEILVIYFCLSRKTYQTNVIITAPHRIKGVQIQSWRCNLQFLLFFFTKPHIWSFSHTHTHTYKDEKCAYWKWPHFKVKKQNAIF